MSKAGQGLLAMCMSFLASAASGANSFERDAGEPLRFFEGSTEMMSSTQIIAQKPFVTRALGRGRISKDGTLDLVQHVDELGRRQFNRFWHIRQVAPGRFGGTMSEAVGPVTIENKGGRYLFRFRLKDDLSVEEWLIPAREDEARLAVTVRKYGIAVAHSRGWIRKVG